MWKAILSGSKNLLNVAGKKRAPGEVPSTSESILMTLLLLQKVAVNEVRVHFPILALRNRASFVEISHRFYDPIDMAKSEIRKVWYLVGSARIPSEVFSDDKNNSMTHDFVCRHESWQP